MNRNSTARPVIMLIPLALLCVLFVLAGRAYALRIVPANAAMDTLILGVDKGTDITVYDGTTPFRVVSKTGVVRSEVVPGKPATFKIVPVKTGTDTITAIDRRGLKTTRAYTVVSELTVSYPVSNEQYLNEPFRFQISGGSPPYVVTPRQPTVIWLKDLRNGLYECVLRTAAAEFDVKDSKRGTMTLRLATVPIQPMKAALSQERVNAGTSVTLQVSGGIQPYTVAANNDFADIKAGASPYQYVVTGRKPGHVTLTVNDRRGMAAYAAVQVEPGIRLEASSNILVHYRNTIEATPPSMTIHDGYGPFQFTSATGAIQVLAGTSHTQFRLKALKKGPDTITVSDVSGKKAALSFTVIEELAFTYLVNERIVGRPFRFQVSGGIPPYQLSPFPANTMAFRDLGNGIYEANLSVENSNIGVVESSTRHLTRSFALTAKDLNKPAPPPPPFTAHLAYYSVNMGSATSLALSGGAPPYTATSANTEIAEVRPDLTILGKKPGTSVITMKDSAGHTVQNTLEVAYYAPGVAFSIIVPNQNIQTGNSIDVTVMGGILPYTVTPSSTAVSIAPQSSGVFRITAVSPGAPTVTFTDYGGKSISKGFSITGPAIPPVDLKFSTKNIPVGDGGILDITGGSPPYDLSATDGNSRVERISPASFRIVGVTAGPSRLSFRDSRGFDTLLTVTITEKRPMQASLGVGNIKVGGTTKLMITYGTPPYVVTPSNAAALVAADSTYFYTITGQTPGKVTITVRDARGESVPIVLTVDPLAPQPFSYSITTPGPQGNALLNTEFTFQLSGGTAPYGVSGENVSVRRVSDNLFVVRFLRTGATNVVLADSAGKTLKHYVTVLN